MSKRHLLEDESTNGGGGGDSEKTHGSEAVDHNNSGSGSDDSGSGSNNNNNSSDSSDASDNEGNSNVNEEGNKDGDEVGNRLSEESEEEEDDDDDRSRSKSRSGSDDDEDRSASEDDDEGSRSRSRSGGSESVGSGGGGGGGSPRRRSHSGGSGSGSDSSGSQNSGSSAEAKRRRKREKEKLWENDPELYGIRRSNRPKYEMNSKPPKLERQTGFKRGSPSKHGKSSKGGSPSSAGKVKRRKISTEDDDSSDEESTRAIRSRGANQVSYKEAESDDDEDMMTDGDEDESASQENGDMEPEEHVETIEKVMESRMGKKGATGSCTTLYTVGEKGDPNETLPADTETEKQFFIKWVGWSHLHNTWESLETLSDMKVKGLKKLDNFCKKEDDSMRWKSYASPEEVEYNECQSELQQELNKLYVNAERIIAERTNDEGMKEYFVKWECLSYAEATWENADLIRKRSPEAIKLFKRREASTRTPSASSKCLKYRPKFSAMKSQPDFLKGDAKDLILRDYQVDGVNWLVHSWCKENSVILADEMGLGKTIQTICFLNYLFETHNLYGPYLLIVPLSTMTAWQKEFAQWAPNINVVTYLGDIPSRDIIRDYEWFFQGSRKIKFNAILTTYEIILKDKAFLMTVPWAAMMVDEAHRLKNGDSLLYKTLLDFESNHRLLITGTPLQNSLKELWSLLHFIMPFKFDDWESFDEEHDHSATKGYAKLHKQLEPYILRRVKKDVEKSLPAKVEQILRVEMTTIQKQYYKWILTKNYTALRKGNKGSASSFVNVVMELKKCCNHASLIRPLEQLSGGALQQLIKGSGKLMLLDKLLVRLKETGHRVLIFSQMVMMLDIIAEYLQLRRFAFQRLDGSIKGDMRKQALDHFNAEGSNDFCFLLSTRAGGLGINLATADTVIIFDSDWNPQNDLQAQARAHRIGQKNQVMIYRLVTKKSVEEDIVERAKQKMVLDHLVIQRMDTTGRMVLDSNSKGSKSGAGNPFNKDELNAILKFGAEELFKDEGENEGGEDNCDIDEILRRAETHEEAARPGDDLLSAFKVATFNVNEDDLPEVTSNSAAAEGTGEPKDWDQIIPEDIRKKVEAQEKEKEMADLYLPPRSSRNAAGNADVKPALGNEALNRKYRNQKRKRGEKASEEELSESDDDGRPTRKRGRPKHGKDPKYTDIQVRKFLKSLKKFASPLNRIDKVAEDCGMTDKPIAELKKLAQELLDGCQQAIADQKAHPQLVVKEEPQPIQEEGEPGADGAKKRSNKPREKGPIFKVHGCGINARTMSIAVDELEPLGIMIPPEEVERKKWKLELKVKNALFDVDWGQDDDTKLLLAVWEYGMGNWDKILESDPVLKEKIFLEGEKKPLVKHASSRVDYLLRVMKKHVAVQKLKQPKLKKKKEPKAKVKKESGVSIAVGVDGIAVAALPNADGVSANAAGASGANKGNKKEKKKRGRKKKDDMPKHFAAGAEPTPVSILGDLDPTVFNECKEKMRPVKKALKSLDTRDPAAIETKEFQTQFKECLLQIGRQIDACLKEYEKEEKDKCKLWKSYLWYFVSKFTDYDAKMLHKYYKKMRKDKSDKKSDKDEGSKGEGKEKREKKNKVKDKHRSKDKDKKLSRREKDEPNHSVSSFHENSNSSLGDAFRAARPGDGGKTYKQYREERDRGRSFAGDARDEPRERIRVAPSTRDFRDDGRVRQRGPGPMDQRESREDRDRVRVAPGLDVRMRDERERPRGSGLDPRQERDKIRPAVGDPRVDIREERDRMRGGVDPRESRRDDREAPPGDPRSRNRYDNYRGPPPPYPPSYHQGNNNQSPLNIPYNGAWR